MKKQLLILVMLAGPFLVFGQDDAAIPGNTSTEKTKSGDMMIFLQVSAGPALPTGDFGDSDGNSIDAGGATTGLYLGFDGGIVLKSGLGFKLNISGTAHFIEFDGIDLSNSLWSYGNFMVGPMYHTTTGNILFEAHILGGRTVTTYDLDAIVIDSATSFGLMIGGNLKLRLGNTFYISGGIDVISANPYFSDSDFEQSVTALNLTGGLGLMF